MSGPPFVKKLKIEADENGKTMEEENRNEQEEALLALIDHRTKEVVHLRQRVSYYTSQVQFVFLFLLGFIQGFLHQIFGELNFFFFFFDSVCIYTTY